LNCAKQNPAGFDWEKKSIIKSFASQSVAGMNSNGSRKINQDVFFAKNYILGHKNYSLFGVYDGHGIHLNFLN
jgi:serine/threonine protein phosphatase PrpC